LVPVRIANLLAVIASVFVASSAQAGYAQPEGAELSRRALERQQKGHPDEAVEMYRQVVDLREKLLGPQHKDVAVALNNLGVALRLAGRTAEADPVFRRALQIAEASSDRRLLATVLGGLGATLVDAGEYPRAEPVLRRSLALFDAAVGPDSLESAEALNNLAMLYRRTGDMARAQDQLERALPLMEKHLGSLDPSLAIALNSMFVVLAEQKQWDRAEPFLRRALAIGQEVFPDSAQMSEFRENLTLLNAHRSRAKRKAPF
jgi:tetratricopeptide (TPR) repeat protein